MNGNQITGGVFYRDSDGNIKPWDGDQLILPQEDDETKPTLAFGDGDTGFFEGPSDNIFIGCNSLKSWEISNNTFGGYATNMPVIRNSAATATNPNFTHYGDPDTGIGKPGADAMTLIAGGVEGYRISEVAGDITHEFTGVVNNNSAKMAVIAAGAYTGDDSVNRAIPHGLGIIPKFITIYPIATDTSWVVEMIHIGYIFGTWNGGYVRLAVTNWDATNFYVGNATNYIGTANSNLKEYKWVAMA